MKKTLTLILTILILFSFSKSYSQANAGPDQTICTDSTYLEALAPTPNSGQWFVISGSGTIEDPTLYNTLVTNLSQGTNEYRWEVTVGVDVFYDDVVITYNLPPIVTFELAPDAPQRIPDAIFTFKHTSDQNLVSYQWDFGNTVTRYDVTYIPQFDYEYNVPGTYIISLEGTSSDLCRGTYQDTVIVLPACPFSWNDGSTIAKGCEDLTVDFYNDVYYANNFMFSKWNYYGPYDNVPSNIDRDTFTYVNDPIFTYTEPGIFHPYITAWNESCGSELSPYYYRSDTVIVYTKPIVDFDVSPNHLTLPSLLTCFNYSEYGERFLWDFGDTIFSFSENPQHLYTKPGVYDISLYVWSEHDCFASDSILNAVIVESNPNQRDFIIFPNPSHGYYYVSSEIDLRDTEVGITNIFENQVSADISHFSDKYLIIDLKNNSSGLYFLFIKNDTFEYVFKLMKN